MAASCLAVLGLAVLAGGGQSLTVDNTKVRLDTNGNGINAHDGHILIDGNGTYWLFGTRYPDCLESQDHCGWGMGPLWPNGTSRDPSWGSWGDNDFAAYSSPDLVSWTLRNPQMLPPRLRPRGTYFRPKVLHNPRGAADARWILWGNWVNMSTGGAPGGMRDYHSYYFSASRPQGPYTIQEFNITMGSVCSRARTGWFPCVLPEFSWDSQRIAVHPKGWPANGDFTLFQDDDGKAYIDYHSYGCPAWPGVAGTPCVGVDGSHAVDLLTDDYTKSTGRTSGLFDIRGSEAPVMLKKNAATPLGPYTDSGRNLNPCAAAAAAGGGAGGGGPAAECGLLKQSCMPGCGNKPHRVKAQQSFVLQIPGSEIWMWGGDLWASAADHLKSHDLQSWLPFTFDSGNLPRPLEDLATWELNIPPPPSSTPR